MAANASSAFDLLDQRVQRWIWKEGWSELRDIQEEAIPAILPADQDVVIASATASGKTEAAFLPIGSVLATDEAQGLGVLYVSPLKALINDQHRRLEGFFAELNLPVHRWHGDVAASRKREILRKPSGVLLITPESLEALFVRRGSTMPRLTEGLRFVVVDELHAFIGTERGRQLQSLLHRVELAARRRIPRVALSATLGDMDLACAFLRPQGGTAVRRIVSSGNRQEVRLQIRGYRITPPRMNPEAVAEAEREGSDIAPEDVATGDALDISEDLFRKLRGGRHLVFANRRADVELYSDLLRRLSERRRVPNEFWPHHGSLDKTLREDAEASLKASDRPATVIATTTLELGIDVGSVETIVQIGPPPSVASMRQRLGRSGRRGDPAVLRIYIQEGEITPETPPQDQLRSGLVQAVAMVYLLAERWYEPPVVGALHLSTLTQQVLSLIAQHGGLRANQAWTALCEHGPFADIDVGMFAELLRDLGRHELITQTHTNELVLDLKGERLVNSHDFYAAFATPEEFRLVAGGKTLGTLPIIAPVLEGMYLIFGGRRWRVLSVDGAHKLIELAPAAGGKAPRFGGAGALVHDRVREEMRRVYMSDDEPAFLNATGLDLLEEGRAAFHRFGLTEQSLLQWGKDTLVFPWAGDRIMNTLLVQLRGEGFVVSGEGLAILVQDTSPGELRACLRALVEAGPADARAVARSIRNKHTEKHHVFLGDSLLSADYASGRLDTSGAYAATLRLLGEDPAMHSRT